MASRRIRLFTTMWILEQEQYYSHEQCKVLPRSRVKIVLLSSKCYRIVCIKSMTNLRNTKIKHILCKEKYMLTPSFFSSKQFVDFLLAVYGFAVFCICWTNMPDWLYRHVWTSNDERLCTQRVCVFCVGFNTILVGLFIFLVCYKPIILCSAKKKVTKWKTFIVRSQFRTG